MKNPYEITSENNLDIVTASMEKHRLADDERQYLQPEEIEEEKRRLKSCDDEMEGIFLFLQESENAAQLLRSMLNGDCAPMQLAAIARLDEKAWDNLSD